MTNITAPTPQPLPALACLLASPVFAGVPEALLAPLVAQARERRWAAGREVFRVGQSADVFYAIAEGEVQLYRPTAQGENKVFQQLGAGELLAEATMFLEPARYPVAARVERDCLLYAFPRQALLELCEHAPSLMRALLSAMSRRLYEVIDRVEQLSLNNAGQRLVSYLLDLRHHSQSHWIDIPVSINVLAGQLAMTPETLSRLLQKYRQAGLVSGKGRTLVLVDIDALCALVGLPPPQAGRAMGAALQGCCNLR